MERSEWLLWVVELRDAICMSCQEGQEVPMIPAEAQLTISEGSMMDRLETDQLQTAQKDGN